MGTQACPETAALSKYALPGVRGSRRQELVLPFTAAFEAMVAAPLQQPATSALLAALLGHPVAIEFVSVIVSWPGADAQTFHRDAQAAAEANLLMFVPLDEMAADTAGKAGPPEFCRKPPPCLRSIHAHVLSSAPLSPSFYPTPCIATGGGQERGRERVGGCVGGCGWVVGVDGWGESYWHN